MQKNLGISGVVIWTQPSCPACDTAKKLMDQLGISYETKSLDSTVTKQLFFSTFPGARSVPQIMVNGTWVGGLQELKTYLNDNLKALKMV
jgi:glutaredoxin